MYDFEKTGEILGVPEGMVQRSNVVSLGRRNAEEVAARENLFAEVAPVVTLTDYIRPSTVIEPTPTQAIIPDASVSTESAIRQDIEAAYAQKAT